MLLFLREEKTIRILLWIYIALQVGGHYFLWYPLLWIILGVTLYPLTFLVCLILRLCGIKSTALLQNSRGEAITTDVEVARHAYGPDQVRKKAHSISEERKEIEID